MGMCAVTFCCPPACAAATATSSILSCVAPKLALNKVWLVTSGAVLVLGLVIYLHMTVKCRELTATSLGHMPKNHTGVWVNTTYPEGMDVYQYAKNFWGPRRCDWPETGICDYTVDSDGNRAQDGFSLVNYTEIHLGNRDPLPWSPSPLAYQGFGCWSEGGSNAGAYYLNGMVAAFFMAGGASFLLLSGIVFLFKVTFGSCCGKPLDDPEAAAVYTEFGVPVQ